MIDDETLAQMADSPYQVVGRISSINSSAWSGCIAGRWCQTKTLKEQPIRSLAMRLSRKESQCFIPLMDKILNKDWKSWDKLLTKWLGQDFALDPRIFDLAVFSTGCEDAIEHLLEYAKCKLLQMWEDPDGSRMITPSTTSWHFLW